MAAKYLAIDFEYNTTKEEKLQVVCCSFKPSDGEMTTRWVYKDTEAQEELANELNQFYLDDYIFLAYNCQAEAGAILSITPNNLPLYVEDIDWFDLFLEYRMLSNHSHRFCYGDQYENGKVTKRKPYVSAKGAENLAAAAYKLLGYQIDTEHKDAMRDLIISAPEQFRARDRHDIMKYCESDVVYLTEMKDVIIKEFKYRLGDKFNGTALRKEVLYRGQFAARTAITERGGYSIDYKSTRNFALSVNSILKDVQREINQLFPDIAPFKRNRDLSYSRKEQPIRDWIESLPFKGDWELTDSGKYSLKLEAFSKHFHYRHTYPTDCFGAQMLRYNKLKQSLNGFVVAKNGTKKKFWDYVGTDERVRPYLNIYKAQSSRTQPAATSFIPLKAAWMRALILPHKGRAMGSIDFGSQEFLIGGLLSRDMAMLKAYASGDVYLWWGIESGGIPVGATKKSHAKLRDKYKSTTLGLQYGMSKIGLSKKLTNDTGEYVSEDEAQLLIDLFFSIFPDFKVYMEELAYSYAYDGHIKLADGFYMWGDNDNKRSVANMPIQGMGAAIMRKAVCLAQDAGLMIPYTLHDALYIEGDTPDIYGEMETLANCMDEAFRFYFPADLMEWCNVRLDGDVWSKDFPEEPETFEIDYCEGSMEVKAQQTYIDPRAEKEYHQFKKYFKNNVAIEDL